MLNKTVLFAIFALFCQISHQNPTKFPTEKIAYDECGKLNSCFGLPENCLGDKTCEVLLTTEPIDQEEVKFSLFWTRSSNSTDRWVAAGISSNGKMDGASVTLLTLDQNNTVNAQQGEAFVGNFTGFKPFTVEGIMMLTRKYIAGQVYGEWIRGQRTTVNNSTFDLKTTKYYILLAYGPVKDGKIQHHTKAWVSANAVDLETDPTYSGNTTTSRPATTSKATTSKSTPTGTAATTVTLPKSTGSPASPTVTSTPGNSTATGTATAGNSTVTGTPSNTTSTPQPSSTKGPGGNASALTMSLFLTIFVSILLFLN
jgi:hypothetical protein